ncbi:MAG: GNAT family N-acetyltransferase [Pseudomonadota bacterium]
MKYVPLKVEYARDVAGLHIIGIPTGFISSLGQEFVAALYEAIAEDKNSFGFVAVENDKVLGFVAFSTNLSKLYKYVILKRGIKFAFVLVQKMMSFKVLKKVWDNLFYPSRMKRMDLPDAGLLSIVVALEGRGKGIAKQLVNAGFAECRKRGIDKVKVLVAEENQAANQLYKRCGFELNTKIDSHGIRSNIYVRDLAKEK